MNLALFPVCCILAGDGSKHTVPASLCRAISKRMCFNTAFFQYEYEADNPGIWHHPAHRYEARFAGEGDVYWTEFGDHDGIVKRDPRTGRPRFGVNYACSPVRTVRSNSGKDEWTIRDGEFMLHGRPTLERIPKLIGRAPEKLLDPRSAGLFPRAYSERSPDHWLEEFQSIDQQWSERQVDDLIEVTASTEDAAASDSPFVVFIWRIDPKRDHAIVDIRGFVEERDGSRKLIEHMQATHQRVDGRWWPKRCETRFTKGGGEVFSFSKVEFDRKQHPAVLDPDILGVPPGLEAVDRINYDPASGSLRVGRYIGGGTVVSGIEWHSIHQQFDAGAKATYVQNATEHGRGLFPRWWSAGEETLGLKNVEHTPDLWEAYVRRWIIRHSHDAAGNPGERLTPGQVEAAWGILKDCRKRAAPILQRMERPPVTKTIGKEETADQEASGDAPADGVANGKASTEPPNIAKAETDGAKPKRPNRHEIELEKIFESLKTRLNGLLTSKQEKSKAGEDLRVRAKP
ncbi:MAG TPA: hypothetical protein VNT79_07140 [Phycisphaerae bacterium]|nr:hypothetical protein [Phycisphaerae bacterium]